MAKYRKKPVVIDAWSVRDIIVTDGVSPLPPPIAAAIKAGNFAIFTENVEVRTLAGVLVGNKTDMVICGVKGELYPCAADVFETSYEPA